VPIESMVQSCRFAARHASALLARVQARVLGLTPTPFAPLAPMEHVPPAQTICRCCTDVSMEFRCCCCVPCTGYAETVGRDSAKVDHPGDALFWLPIPPPYPVFSLAHEECLKVP